MILAIGILNLSSNGRILKVGFVGSTLSNDVRESLSVSVIEREWPSNRDYYFRRWRTFCVARYLSFSLSLFIPLLLLICQALVYLSETRLTNPREKLFSWTVGQFLETKREFFPSEFSIRIGLKITSLTDETHEQAIIFHLMDDGLFNVLSRDTNVSFYISIFLFLTEILISSYKLVED